MGLEQLFATTLSSDPNVRRAGELEIRKIEHEEGVIAALLQIIAADIVATEVRQACAIWLKNRVYTSYTLEAPSVRRPDLVPIKAGDRQALRQAMLPLLSRAPTRTVAVQLSHTLKNMVAHDLPKGNWPSLIQEIKLLLASSDPGQIYAGSLAALECVRAFRFRQKADILPNLIAEIFPALVNIANQLISAPPGTDQDVPAILHLILKTYKTSIGIRLSNHQQSPESIVPWGQLLFKVVNLHVPDHAVPSDEDDRQVCEWWKTKKWAYNTLGRLFRQYGNPSQLPSSLVDDYAQFAQHFATVFAPEILTIYLQQVDLYVRHQAWLSNKCQYLIFQFFTECVKPKSTWIQLKPHFETLVSSFVFPQLTFNEHRQQMWESDPIDYIRTSIDEYDTFSSPTSAATGFLFSLASNRTKIAFMPILGFINQVLRSNPSPIHEFGALNMTAALCPWIMRHPEVKNNMEQFILQFVTPKFVDTRPYLRAIALEILGTATKHGLTWSNKANLEHHFTIVVSSLDDLELPVRVQAALTLTELVLIHEEVKIAVSPRVGKVIQDLLKLLDETELEILNRSMEVMVDQFHTELLPVATQLSARLCESYLRLAGETLNQEELLNATDNIDIEESLTEIDDDKTFAAMGVAKTISTVLTSIETSPEILAQVQEVIIPIIFFTLDHSLLELLDNMYELVDNLTYKTRSIAPNMWPVFELSCNLFKSEAIDFLDEMLPSLDNFISFGSDVIKARADYKQMLFEIYRLAMCSDQLGENDRVNGSKLAESMLLNLRGSLDDSLQGIITIALSAVETAQGTAFKLANLEVLINTVLYNPVLALHIMEGIHPGMARTFFDQWFVAINAENKLPRVHDKKLTIVTLCALMELNMERIPNCLRDGWFGILGCVIKMFKELPKAIQARKELEQAMQEEADTDDEVDDKFLNFADNEDDVWDQDSAYMEVLAKESARLREQSENQVERQDGNNNKSVKDNVDEDEDDDEEGIEEELGYISPLDSVDPYVAFKQALGHFEVANPQMYQLATTSLDIEQQTQLMEIIRQAEKNVMAR